MTTAGGPTTSAYDAADRLTSVTPRGQGAISYSYDGNDSRPARGSDSFSGDAENRLTSATVSGTTTTATYNGDGLRLSRTSGGTTMNFVWDASAIPQLLDDGTQYVYGKGRIAHVASGG